jgi:hypothetical protein
MYHNQVQPMAIDCLRSSAKDARNPLDDGIGGSLKVEKERRYNT